MYKCVSILIDMIIYGLGHRICFKCRTTAQQIQTVRRIVGLEMPTIYIVNINDERIQCMKIWNMENGYSRYR